MDSRAVAVRRLAASVLYATFLVTVLLAVDLILFWRPFYQELQHRSPVELEAPAPIDAVTMRRIGSLRVDRKSSFTHFQVQKAAHTFRLCAFGDSFTFGDEVADGHDFPALLQGVYREHGVDNVEVLNFGSSWWGFHQAYILWDAVGRKYGCDYILLGPDCFQTERDTTFHHSNFVRPYYLHARYVLDGADDARLVDVAGDTAQERFAAYFGFLPRWNYLRYDRHPPAMIQAVIGERKTVPNVFYYDRRPADDEAQAIYAILLRHMAADDVQIVLFHSTRAIVAMAKSVGKDNLSSAWTPRVMHYPYVAVGGHYSAFGNRLVAEQYYTRLADCAVPMTMLAFDDLPGGDTAPTPSAPLPLSQYDSVGLQLENQPTGFLVTASPDPVLRVGEASDLKGSAVASLLGFESDGDAAVDAGFVPLRTAVHNGDEITLRIRTGAHTVERNVGTIRLIDPRVGIGLVRVKGLSFDSSQLLFRGSTDFAADLLQPGSEVTALLGSEPILQGTVDQGPVSLATIGDPVKGFRLGESEYVNVSEMPSEGVVTLSLRGGGGDIAVPFAHWHKLSVSGPCEEPPST